VGEAAGRRSNMPPQRAPEGSTHVIVRHGEANALVDLKAAALWESVGESRVGVVQGVVSAHAVQGAGHCSTALQARTGVSIFTEGGFKGYSGGNWMMPW
jgi:hypothetical protein